MYKQINYWNGLERNAGYTYQKIKKMNLNNTINRMCLL